MYRSIEQKYSKYYCPSSRRIHAFGVVAELALKEFKIIDMKNPILTLKKEIANIDHNINGYEKMSDIYIDQKDRNRTISDLKNMKLEYLKAVEILNG